MSSQNHLRNPSECPPRYGMGQEMRRFHSHRRHLNKILGETQKSLKDVEHLELFPLETEISDTVRLSRDKLTRPPTLVVMGPARARLVNYILGEAVLPPGGAGNNHNAQQSKKVPSSSRGWRWLRFQHGPKKQIRFSFGSDIEVVEPSLFLESGWEQIPYQVLKRNDNLDLSTVMDVDLCHPLLEHGLQILVPPDLSNIPRTNKASNSLSQDSVDSKDQEFFFTKRGSLLEDIIPVIIYALDQLDETVRKIDLNKIRTKMKQMTVRGDHEEKQKNDDDSNNSRNSNFVTRFKDFKILSNLKMDERNGCSSNCDRKSDAKFYVNIEAETSSKDKCGPGDSKTNGEKCSGEFKMAEDESYAGLSDENLLDLRQIYELHPTAQVLFVLFSNSVESTKNTTQQMSAVQLKVDSNDSYNRAPCASLGNHSYNESPLSLDSKYLKSECGYSTMNTTASECSSITSHLSEYMRNFSPLEYERLHVVVENYDEENGSVSSLPHNRNKRPEVHNNNDKMGNIVTHGGNIPNFPAQDWDANGALCDKLMGSSVDSMMFAMDDDKDKLLDKQRTYLATLVQQLGFMTHPLSKTKFTGRWLIVDDSQRDDPSKVKSSSEEIKRYRQNSAGEESEGGVLQRDSFMYSLVNFTKGCLQNYILDDCTNLSEVHNALLQQFILSSFDMAREMQIIPRRIQYVAQMEQHLYGKLVEKFSGCDKREELHSIIEKVLQDMRHTINTMDWAGNCRGSRECLNMSNSVFYSTECNEMTQTPSHIINSTTSTQLTDFGSNADILENITNDILRGYHLVESIPRETTDAEEVNEKTNPLDQYAGAKGCRNVVNFEYGMSSNLQNGYNQKYKSSRTNSNLKMETDGTAAACNSMLESNLKLSSKLENALTSISKTEHNLKMEQNGLKVESNDLNSEQSDFKIDNGINLNVEVLKGVDSTDSGNFSNDSTSNNSNCSKVSFKQASLDVQRMILAKLSRNISIQLVNYVDCLRDSYFGTLQRCLEALEEGQGMRSASEAVRRILLVTRSVDLQQCASFSFLNVLVDQLRTFFRRLSMVRGGAPGGLVTGGEAGVSLTSCCVDSPRWRKQVAHNTVDSLNATKLCKIISTQLRDRVRVSHEQFQSALHTLSEHHLAHLQQTEDLKIAVRKHHAPRFARLCLESTSLADLVKYGLPHLGKEIGRGQYGVVYAVKSPWADCSPLAVKSVVPPDDRHFNELAMEFFHTRNIPPHDRIVRLVGSVIDHTYGGGGGLPAVLLVSERFKWDLHCALAHGTMTFVQRMQVAVDIVEGIRYLHSQGLVHRDIKLKNVLLREDNRAMLTDLGFCIPEAMISGSVVGTPVHMAPELLNGFYDYSVDVYAFGILFWYLCAGQVRIPSAFEHFHNKEQLWFNVQKGLRPERLPMFSDACWDLMRSCWSGDPNLRPMLGDVQPVLEHARDHPEEHVLGYVSE